MATHAEVSPLPTAKKQTLVGEKQTLVGEKQTLVGYRVGMDLRPRARKPVLRMGLRVSDTVRHLAHPCVNA